MTEELVDNELVTKYVKEYHFPLNSYGVYLKKAGSVWSVCLGDEDELIIEDEEKGITLENGDPPYAVYHQALISPDVLNMAKSLVKEEENKNERD